jgi:hypothetical protein
LALVYWTYMDAKRRVDDQILVACATAASLFPYVGTIVYTILRPPEFLDDVRERALETRAAELRVRQLTEQACPNCQFPVERGFIRCPSCHTRLKDPCPSCSEPLDPRWSMCPYCETPVQARGRRPAPAPEPAERHVAQAPPAETEPAREQKPRRRRQTAGARKAPAGGSQAKPARAAASTEDSGKRPANTRSGARRTAAARDGASEEQTRPARTS